MEKKNQKKKQPGERTREPYNKIARRWTQEPWEKRGREGTRAPLRSGIIVAQSR